jgi:hypothetical protein
MRRRVWREGVGAAVPVMGEGCDDIKKIKQEAVSKFEEDFVSYDRLKEEWESESPSLVNRSLWEPVFVLSLRVSYRGGEKRGKPGKVEG